MYISMRYLHTFFSQRETVAFLMDVYVILCYVMLWYVFPMFALCAVCCTMSIWVFGAEGPRTPAYLRLVRHTVRFRLEVYWTRNQVGVRRKADGKNLFLVGGVSNLKVGILLANEAVSCLEFDCVEVPSLSCFTYAPLCEVLIVFRGCVAGGRTRER